MYRIFLVEDDAAITEVLERQLARWDFAVTPVRDFGRVLEEFEAAAPHLVVLDVSLPRFDGYYWCRAIRAVSQCPILFLTSAADDGNLVMALGLGADDYLAKPVRLEVLVAKLQALLRRAYSFGGDASQLVCGELVLRLDEALLLWRDSRMELTRNELRIMQMLMENERKVVAREALIQRLWESESFIDDNTLTVNMARLRKKLEEMGLENVIQTKRGMGYQLEVPA